VCRLVVISFGLICFLELFSAGCSESFVEGWHFRCRCTCNWLVGRLCDDKPSYVWSASEDLMTGNNCQRSLWACFGTIRLLTLAVGSVHPDYQASDAFRFADESFNIACLPSLIQWTAMYLQSWWFFQAQWQWSRGHGALCPPPGKGLGNASRLRTEFRQELDCSQSLWAGHQSISRDLDHKPYIIFYHI
jgi:hypothetical protein